ncbi:MAG: divalent-cation tolerance protein CutA [Cyanobacteria bacterium]|nr:divalent-cation tolerance protein CutA [Cyanobacteriota bacterium]MDA1020628.1 divalent-cation tolerance protein CutA [Cyanobacteriota bacterium]
MILIYLTCENETEAKAIAKQLLDENLIACANIFPQIYSIYKWQGKIEQASESVAILKTKKENYSKLKTRIQELHSYDCPCVVSIPVDKVNEECLSWLINEL